MRLDTILDSVLSMKNEIPDENTVKALLAQSMVVGVSISATMITQSESWKTAFPFIKDAVADIPLEEDKEIAARIVNAAESLWPNFILSVGSNKKKKVHVAGILKALIQECRNGSTN